MSIQYHYNICNILVVPEQDNTTKYCTNFPNRKSFKSRSNPPAPSASSLMPPIAPAIPYLLGSASSNAPKQKTGFMQIIW